MWRDIEINTDVKIQLRIDKFPGYLMRDAVDFRSPRGTENRPFCLSNLSLDFNLTSVGFLISDHDAMLEKPSYLLERK